MDIKNIIHLIKTEKAPDGFTNKVMDQISSTQKEIEKPVSGLLKYWQKLLIFSIAMVLLSVPVILNIFNFSDTLISSKTQSIINNISTNFTSIVDLPELSSINLSLLLILLLVSAIYLFIDSYIRYKFIRKHTI